MGQGYGRHRRPGGCGKVMGKDVGRIGVGKGGRAGGRTGGRGMAKVKVRGKQWCGSCKPWAQERCEGKGLQAVARSLQGHGLGLGQPQE